MHGTYVATLVRLAGRRQQLAVHRKLLPTLTARREHGMSRSADRWVARFERRSLTAHPKASAAAVAAHSHRSRVPSEIEAVAMGEIGCALLIWLQPRSHVVTASIAAVHRRPGARGALECLVEPSVGVAAALRVQGRG